MGIMGSRTYFSFPAAETLLIPQQFLGSFVMFFPSLLLQILSYWQQQKIRWARKTLAIRLIMFVPSLNLVSFSPSFFFHRRMFRMKYCCTRSLTFGRKKNCCVTPWVCWTWCQKIYCGGVGCDGTCRINHPLAPWWGLLFPIADRFKGGRDVRVFEGNGHRQLVPTDVDLPVRQYLPRRYL